MQIYGVTNGDSPELEWIICDRQISVILENGDRLDFSGIDMALTVSIDDNGKVTSLLEYRIEIAPFNIDPSKTPARFSPEALGFEFYHLLQRYVVHIKLDCSKPAAIERDGVNLRIRTKSRIPSQILLGLRIFGDARKNSNTCQRCQHYHGGMYGGNLLVCAMHPYGPEAESCNDFKIWALAGDRST